MITSQRPHHSLFITLFFMLSMMLTWDAPVAFSAVQPCEVFTPTNFEKLSLDKKIKVTEVIRECERKLKDSKTKDLRPAQEDTRALAYITARANQRAY